MTTPLKAIRAKCLECSAGQPKEVRECNRTECPNYPYRFGSNPKRVKIGGKKCKSDGQAVNLEASPL